MNDTPFKCENCGGTHFYTDFIPQRKERYGFLWLKKRSIIAEQKLTCLHCGWYKSAPVGTYKLKEAK